MEPLTCFSQTVVSNPQKEPPPLSHDETVLTYIVGSWADEAVKCLCFRRTSRFFLLFGAPASDVDNAFPR